MLRFHLRVIYAGGVICAGALALAGCTQAPLAPKLDGPMESAVTGRDWNNIAHRISAELGARGMLVPPTAGLSPAAQPWGPMFIHTTIPDSAFLKAVAMVLKADIIAAGGTVADVPTGAMVINLNVDFVRHGPKEQAPGGIGTYAGMLAGLSALSHATAVTTAAPWVTAGAQIGSVVAAGVLTDVFLLNNPTYTGEAFWSASIMSKQQVLMQVGGAVYIPGPDIPLYAGDAKLAALTTPGVSDQLQVVSLRYAMPAAAPRPAAAPANPPCRC